MAKNSSSGKVGKGIVIGVLVAVIGIGGACALGYSSRNSAGKWFGGLHWKDTQSNAPSNTIISEGDSNGVELCAYVVSEEDYAAYGIAPQSVENVFELSVTYTPANTTFQETDYTIAFKNPSSTWASGKTLSDYAEIAHESGSKNATLTVKQAFGEQIEVKAINQRDTTKFATFTVDYLNKDVSFYYDDVTYGEDASMSNWEFSTGTIYNLTNGIPNCPDTEDWFVKIIYDFTPVINAVKRCGYENIITVPQYYEYEVSCHSVSMNDGLWDTYSNCRKACGITSANERQFNDALISIGDTEDGRQLATYTMILNRTYNGIDYGTKTLEDVKNSPNWSDSYTLGLDELQVRATSVTANQASIIAG